MDGGGAGAGGAHLPLVDSTALHKVGHTLERSRPSSQHAAALLLRSLVLAGAALAWNRADCPQRKQYLQDAGKHITMKLG